MRSSYVLTKLSLQGSYTGTDAPAYANLFFVHQTYALHHIALTSTYSLYRVLASLAEASTRLQLDSFIAIKVKNPEANSLFSHDKFSGQPRRISIYSTPDALRWQAGTP